MQTQTNTEPQSQGLVKFINENDIPNVLQPRLVESFNEAYEIAKDWQDKAKKLVVTSVEETEKIKNAKVARTILRNTRIAIEKKRKELKEASLREGQAIDKIAKFLTQLIEPAEKHLEEQEKFVEREEAKIKEAIKATRLQALEPYAVETAFYDLANMPNEIFEKLLNDSKLLFEAKQEQERKEKEEQQKRQVINDRINQLVTLGFKLENEKFKHYSGLEYDYHVLDFNESEWNKFLNDIQVEVKRLKTQQEEAAKFEATKIKLLVENNHSYNKLNTSYELLFREIVVASIKQKTLEEMKSQDQLDAYLQFSLNCYEQVKNQEEKLDEILMQRQKELYSIGFSLQGDSMVFNGANIQGYKLNFIRTCETWVDLLNEIKQQVALYKKRLEEDRIAKEKEKEDKVLFFIDVLVANGYISTMPNYWVKEGFGVERSKLEQLNKQEFYERLKQVELKIEEARDEELGKTDKEKFNQIIKQLQAIKTITVKSKKNNKIKADVDTLVDKIVNHINEKL